MNPLEGTDKPEKMRVVPEGYAYHKAGYLWRVLPTKEFAELPETVGVEGLSLTKKNEFHVTVANVREIARTIGGSDEEIQSREQDLLTLFSTYAATHAVDLVHFRDDLRFAKKDDRTSIAARCEVTNLEGFFSEIAERYGYRAPLQPAHVSLYTLTGGAVGINSDEEMEAYTKVELPEVQKALDAVP